MDTGEIRALARHPDTGEWLLTWSAHRWETQDYATGLAVCAGPVGPCDRVTGDRPWVRTSDDPAVAAPARFGGAGGLSFAVGPGDRLLAVLHAYRDAGEWPVAPRLAWTFRVEADPGSPGGYRLVSDGDLGNHPAPISVSGS